jgi:CarD family transcriptional regulator
MAVKTGAGKAKAGKTSAGKTGAAKTGAGKTRAEKPVAGKSVAVKPVVGKAVAVKAVAVKSLTETARPTSPKLRKFRVGDLAVYPAHGVGQIQAVETRVVNGEHHDFYILKVLENGMVIMIPTRNVESVGLRCLIDVKEIPKVYAVMKTKREVLADNQTWNRRYREYMEKIKTGSLYDVAEVFRDLFRLKLTKDLSFGERKLYDTAQVLLVKELSKAKKTDEKTIILEIESLFASEAA